MMVWTVTVARKNTAPSVHVCTDEDAARNLAASFREDFTDQGVSLRDSAIYIQAHGIVTDDDFEEESW
jgi:hypothetical protein